MIFDLTSVERRHLISLNDAIDIIILILWHDAAKKKNSSTMTNQSFIYFLAVNLLLSSQQFAFHARQLQVLSFTFGSLLLLLWHSSQQPEQQRISRELKKKKHNNFTWLIEIATRVAVKLTSSSTQASSSNMRTMKLKRFPDVEFNEINENFVHRRISDSEYFSLLDAELENCTWSSSTVVVSPSHHHHRIAPLLVVVLSVTKALLWKSHENKRHIVALHDHGEFPKLFFLIIVAAKR